MASEWTVRPLEDCMAAIIDYRGKTPQKTSSGIPLITAKVVKAGRIEPPDEFIAADEYELWMRRGIPEAGDVLITTEAPLGEVAQLGAERVALAQRLIALRGKQGVLDNAFLKFLLQSAPVQDQLRARASGTTVLGIKQSELRKVLLALPSVGEQRAIAHILGTLDDKIELNRRMNDTLEAMARALFKSWFVDFDPVRAKAEGRNPGLPKAIADCFPDRFVDSAWGEIPEGWEVGTLESVLSELEVGGRPRGGVSSYTEGVPSIGAESIVGLGRFDYSKTKYVPRSFFDSMKKGHVKDRDVLLYKDGGRPGEYEPHLTLVGDGFPFSTCAINEHVYRLRAEPTLGQHYLFFWLSSDLVMEEMRIKGTGVAIPGLNSTQVQSLTTLVPPGRITGAFDVIAGRIVARILSACSESRTLATFRDALMPKLISGALRVKDAEQFVGPA